MKEFRYRLERWSEMEFKRKWICPACGKKSFVRYVDTISGEYVGEGVGRCDRVEKCGYHLSPREFFEAAGQSGLVHCGAAHSRVAMRRRAVEVERCHFLPMSLVEGSMRVRRNYLGVFLQGVVGREEWRSAAEMYRIGGAEWPEGATVFWQIDYDGKVRTGKVMLYDCQSGRRVKDENCRGRIGWMHSRVEVADGGGFRLRQCLFGEHLLREEDEGGGHRRVGIVESEKTAVICSIFLPEFVWLATGGIQNLSSDRCRHLRGRDVTLYPDLGAYDVWRSKAEGIPELSGCVVSSVLEDMASEAMRAEGWDLADVILEEVAGNRNGGLG